MTRTIVAIGALTIISWFAIAAPIAIACGRVIGRAEQAAAHLRRAHGDPDRAPVNLANATYIPTEWVNA